MSHQYPKWTDFLQADDQKSWEVDPDKLEAWLSEHDFESHPSRRGDWISADCPDCGRGTGEKSWRFMVHAEKGLLSCYGCGLPHRNRKDPFQLVMDIDGVDVNEARQMIGLVDIVTVDDSWREKRQERDEFILEEAVSSPDITGVYWWDGGDLPAAWMAEALQAVMARGYTLEFLKTKSLGFGHTGRYEGRVIIPVFVNGQFVWLQAWDWTRESEIKYHSPKRGDGMLRSNLVYQLDQYRRSEVIVVCEGMFNAWAAELAGYAAVATFGKGLTKEQFDLILQTEAKVIVFAFDDDARAVAARWANELRQVGRTVLMVRYPDGRDLDDHETATVVELIQRATPPDWYFDSKPAFTRAKPRRPGGPPSTTL